MEIWLVQKFLDRRDSTVEGLRRDFRLVIYQKGWPHVTQPCQEITRKAGGEARLNALAQEWRISSTLAKAQQNTEQMVRDSFWKLLDQYEWEAIIDWYRWHLE
jgi:hypothetical protein